MIQCKRVYDETGSHDGYRVLIDRLWPRGIKKESLHHDEWCKALAPSDQLRKALHRETIDFATFSQHYREELNALRDEGLRLLAQAGEDNITLLYAANNIHQNHALILADWLSALKDDRAAITPTRR